MASKEKFPKPPKTKKAGQLICLTICGYRRPGMSEEDYRSHMTQVSGPMTKELMVKYGIVRWTMLHNTTETRNLMKQLFDEHMVNLAEFDCFSQVTFRTIEDYKRMRKDPVYRNQVAGDHVNFADTNRSMMTIGWVTDFIEHGKLVEMDNETKKEASALSRIAGPAEGSTKKTLAATVVVGSFLSGCMASLSLMAVPVLLDTATSSPQLLWQWTRMYHYGHQVLPGMSISTFLLYSYVCIRRRRAPSPKPWRLFALAGLVTVSMIPFTLLIMKPTNDELFRLEAATRAMRLGNIPEINVISLQDTKDMVVKWALMHLTRASFPLFGAVMGAWGFFRQSF
ncbi:unnamed protein product [Periconia digitata]|uniref:EthD domain-containing protein n=1 Tax=Periconia digitata TaxID=1303443 RepID=A0A9W4UAC7_9PLEO|nr:unnamed protein product [Periconia digitata]